MTCIPVTTKTTDGVLEKIEWTMRKIDGIMVGGQYNE